MLQVGKAAPAFSLPDADMETFDFGSVRGRRSAVLFFYQKDCLPQCTREAIEFSDQEQDFERLGCVVLGISRDDCISHAEFRDKHGVSVRLLADEDAEVCRQYGVCEDRECNGQHRLWVVRSTFVIDQAGIIRYAFREVNPKGHAADVYRLVQELNGQNRPARRN